MTRRGFPRPTENPVRGRYRDSTGDSLAVASARLRIGLAGAMSIPAITGVRKRCFQTAWSSSCGLVSMVPSSAECRTADNAICIDCFLRDLDKPFRLHTPEIFSHVTLQARLRIQYVGSARITGEDDPMPKGLPLHTMPLDGQEGLIRQGVPGNKRRRSR